jgi:hypothetical protein
MGKYQVEQRTVFLDRDRMLNCARVRDSSPHPPSSVVGFELYEGVAEGRARPKAAGSLPGGVDRAGRLLPSSTLDR